MPAYSYQAINAHGAIVSDEIMASDLDNAREQLRQRGLLPERLSVLSQAPAKKSALSKTPKVKARDLQIFSRQLATLIAAGVSVVQALVVLEEQTEDQALADVTADVRLRVERGMLLSEAMAMHPQIFDRLYVAMVEAGEASGALDLVLDRVAIQIEKSAQIKRRVKSAMIYPSIVLIFATLVLTGMLLFLVPIFVKVFQDLGGDLPFLTQQVMKASDALRAAWFIIIPGIIGSIVLLRRLKRTDRGRMVWDTMVLQMPMKVGITVRKVAMARLSRTLQTLIGAGVDIITALEITSATVGNGVVENAVKEIKVQVEQGIPMAQPLLDNDIFPPMLSQMIKIGEETGELEQMLTKVADFYEDEVDAAIASLTSIVEPVMMLGVGLMVGVIVLSMYMPMFKLLTLIK